jgi:enoyl-CoA hydratase
VSIGFFPDVGATYFLPRLPGKMGTYLALTAARLGPGEGIGLGVATHRIPSARFPELLNALAAGADVAGTLSELSVLPESDTLAGRAGVIGRAFAGRTVEAVLDNLDREARAEGEDAEFARAQAAAMRSKSPTSLKIALEQMHRGSTLDFAECMRTEFRIVNRIVKGHDFFEGVRAVVIDKDNTPRWNPESLHKVGDAVVAAHFRPLAPDTRELPL